MDLSLVLDEEGIAHEVRSVSDTQWALFAEDAAAERAEKALQAFERENPLSPSPGAPEELLSDAGILAGALFGLALIALQLWTGPQSSASAWFERGSAEAAAIVRGEWWRTVTALTLHADEGHAAGNAVLGGLLLALLARRLGAGLACLVPLLSGALGTFCTAKLLRRNFVSVGGRTAGFRPAGRLNARPAR